MKIAIKGHASRGKEVIQILESLGGKNTHELCGHSEDSLYYYNIDSYGIIRLSLKDNLCNYKFYTLEGFKKEFPFKVGDKVITKWGSVGIIRSLTPDNDEIPYCIEVEKGYIYHHPSNLKSYKEMKEERNITLTLNKAKEWYKKGGELKEVALQAFSEKELNPLPGSWKEFCEKYPVQGCEAHINTISVIIEHPSPRIRDIDDDRNICPSMKSAEAHLALIQLEQLRDCWRQEWNPTSKKAVYAIKVCGGKLGVFYYCTREFLSFPTRKMAEEFLKCFKDLIEKAGDLI